MLHNRIKQRIPSVSIVSTVRLNGYRLLFNKRSKDGSSKANIRRTQLPQDELWGVIHQMPAHEKKVLDHIEGLGNGYNQHSLELDVHGHIEEVFTYMAQDPRFLSGRKPFDWYHSFVLQGALENGFPSAYISRIEQIAIRQDPDKERRNRNFSILGKT